jgi:hypothetical protein
MGPDMAREELVRKVVSPAEMTPRTKEIASLEREATEGHFAFE